MKQLTLVSPGNYQIATIKEVRAISGLGLKESVDLVRGPMPQKIPVANYSKKRALELLRSVGAKVSP